MQWTEHQSSVVAATTHHGDRLHVRFTSGDEWSYPVTLDGWEALVRLADGSAGRALNVVKKLVEGRKESARARAAGEQAEPEYRLVYREAAEAAVVAGKLAIAVDELVAQGWEPKGGVAAVSFERNGDGSCASTWFGFSQAMVRRVSVVCPGR